jgi:hypothetical protein
LNFPPEQDQDTLVWCTHGGGAKTLKKLHF